MKNDKSWIIIPMLTVTVYADGTKEIIFGWFTSVFYIRW